MNPALPDHRELDAGFPAARRRRRRWVSALGLLMAALALLGAEAKPVLVAPDPALVLDAQLGEVAWPEETETAERIAATIERSLDARSRPIPSPTTSVPRWRRPWANAASS